MHHVIPMSYLLVLSLWTGGAAMFTFVVTPAIFRSYPRDQAGEIVGRLFPGYFVSLLALSGLALLLFFLQDRAPDAPASRASLVVLVAVLVINTYVIYDLHPRAVRLKAQVATFDSAAPDGPARKAFRRIHAVSAVLNLIVILSGIVLLVLSRHLSLP